MTYSYYITSAINADSQQLEVDFFDIMNGVFGGLEAQLETIIKQHEIDSTMRNEFADILSPTCRYEEIPKMLPISDSGFDITYNFMFSERSHDLIDLIVEEDSLFRIFIETPNPRNNLNVFLY